ncbi:MAG: OmpA family protein [Alphaproteobacteria bacterium]
MHRISIAAAALLALGLAGCAERFTSQNDVIEKAAAVKPTNSYAEALQKGYLDFARAEEKRADYDDAYYFATKATKAASMDAQPDALKSRTLSAAHTKDLEAARKRLIAVLDGGAVAKDGKNAAKAQVMFDCWMEEAEEDNQPADIAACRNGFEEAMKPLEAKPAAAAPAPMPAKDPNSPYTVYFKFNSTDLTADSEKTLADAIASASKLKLDVKVVAHADASGDPAYNKKLSMARADAVAAKIKKAGVASVSVAAEGESMLAVKTGDGVKEAKNRRAVIQVGN